MELRYDYGGMGQYLRGSTDLYEAVNQVAMDVAARARAIARREAYETGAYADSIGVVAERGDDGRVGCVVQATDPKSAAMEFGNAATGGRSRHILRRAAGGAS